MLTTLIGMGLGFLVMAVLFDNTRYKEISFKQFVSEYLTKGKVGCSLSLSYLFSVTKLSGLSVISEPVQYVV